MWDGITVPFLWIFMDKILLIDGRNAIFRANIAFGADPNVPFEHIITYNFFRNLRPIVEQFSPEKIFFVLEGHPKFRHELYAEYKSNRIIKTAEKQESVNKVNLASNIIIDLLQYLPITIAKASNYEADDVINTLCKNMQDENITILSSDTDYIQLLQKYKNVSIYDPRKKEFMVAPTENYIVLKSLMGDKADNIKRLASENKAKLYCNNPDKFKEFLSIEENRANFSINKKLIEFADIDLDEIQSFEGKKDFDTLKDKFFELKFDSIINERSWDKYTKTFDCVKF